MESDSRPRRALPPDDDVIDDPLPDDDADSDATGIDDAAFADAADDDDPVPSPSPRRAMPAVEAVPPPASPSPTNPPAASPPSGRRFSEAALPASWKTTGPRRSATTPSAWSPASPASPAAAPATPTPDHGLVQAPTAADAAPATPRPPAPQAEPSLAEPPEPPAEPPEPTRHSAAVTRPAATETADSPDSPDTSPPRRGGGRGRRVVIVVIAIVLIVLLALGGWWLIQQQRGGSSGASAADNPSSAGYLVTAAEAAKAPGTWSVATTVASVNDQTPLSKCLAGRSSGPVPATTLQRTLTSSVESGALLHRVEVFADVASATAAFAARAAQAGTCPSPDPMYLAGALRVTGAGDEAVLVTAVAQEATVRTHRLLVARTGRAVNIVDVSATGTPITPEAALATTVPAISRECQVFDGACPSTPATSATLLPAGANAGFLGPADLPRITPGVGTWTANNPTATLSASTLCENTSLETSGAQRAFQRSLVLLKDPKAPETFGIDNVVFSFADAAAAKAFAGKLADNLTTCPTRVPSAKVIGTAPITASTGTVDIAGTSVSLTQDAAPTVVPYRAAVLSVGTRVVYLVMTPTTSYGFDDATWAAVAARAAERASQLP